MSVSTSTSSDAFVEAGDHMIVAPAENAPPPSLRGLAFLVGGEGIGRAMPSGNSIPFVFKTSAGTEFHNTFTYVPANDTWQWKLDDATGGKLEPFARVTLTRRK